MARGRGECYCSRSYALDIMNRGGERVGVYACGGFGEYAMGMEMEMELEVNLMLENGGKITGFGYVVALIRRYGDMYGDAADGRLICVGHFLSDGY